VTAAPKKAKARTAKKPTKAPRKAVKARAPRKAVKARVPKKPVKARIPRKAVKARVPKKPVKARVPRKPVKARIPRKAVKARVPKKPVKARVPRKPAGIVKRPVGARASRKPVQAPSPATRGKVVIFGAGLVSRPMVRYLLEHGFQVTVASRTVSKAEALIGGHPLGRAAPVDAEDDRAIQRFVSGCDAAVSLLPANRHPAVARACLDLGKHMVTTSYVSPAMRALDPEARQKGLLLLNEIGVDPGIDHMSAMQAIHAQQAEGWTLTSFTSWCGGLPAPESADDNPFRYKFSWSPRGVLVAAGNPAEYLRDGQRVQIPPARLFAEPARVEIPGVGWFEGYPNRDSVSYMQTYRFEPTQVRTLLRGTLRYPGHCELYSQLVKLGLLAQEPVRDLTGLTYRKLLEESLGGPPEATIPSRLGVPSPRCMEALRFIGLLDDKPVEIARGANIDVMAHRMNAALAFAPGERDMLVMRHDMIFERVGQRRRVVAVLEDYGLPGGDSSMARTVSLPAAVAVRMLLTGQIALRGVQIPVLPELYEPVLAELARLGIRLTESVEPL
jgi:saccharopine dehydrogenase-like NADP-dependent oxidoreductase